MFNLLIGLVTAIGMIIWMIGFICMFSGGKKEIIPIFILFFLIGLPFMIPGLVTIVKEEVITYEVPTSIIKTNNITVVTHIVGNHIVSFNSFNDASYWNSTNIMIKVTNGKNIIKREISPDYEIVNNR